MEDAEVAVDVAVVGAGPAGSTLAALLAKRGMSVALIDRDDFPRDKLCGEFLSYDALPIVDALGVDLGDAPQIARCRVVGRTRSYEFDFPHPARGTSRMFLDAALHRAAVGAGARAITAMATSVSEASVGFEAAGWKPALPDARSSAGFEDAGRIPALRGAGSQPAGKMPAHASSAGSQRTPEIDAQSSAGFQPAAETAEPAQIRARVVAGAWGRWGRFDQQLDRGFVRDRAHRNFGFKRHYRGASDPSTIELYSFARGYLGVSGVEGGITNICGLVHASRLAQHKGRWDRFVERIREEEPRLEAMYARFQPAQEQFLSSEPVIFRGRSAVEGGIFMVGDASGVIDPLTGNGMAMAMQSAAVAVPFIIEALTARDRESVEDAYRRRHHDLFAPRIAWSRRVAALLSRPALLDAALALHKAGPLLLRKTRVEPAEAKDWLRR